MIEEFTVQVPMTHYLYKCDVCGKSKKYTRYTSIPTDIPCDSDCRILTNTLARPSCPDCRGFGLTYHPEDNDPVEGYKLAQKKFCPTCIKTLHL